MQFGFFAFFLSLWLCPQKENHLPYFQTIIWEMLCCVHRTVESKNDVGKYNFAM